VTSLASLLGRPVVSRASADRLGELTGFVVDGPKHPVVALRLGRRRHARFVTRTDLRAIGPDAIVIDDASMVHPAAGPLEEASAKGASDVLGAPVYTSTGMAIGRVSDIDADLDRGLVATVDVGDTHIAGDHILGLGDFALVIDVDMPS
jgi:sporulation protein YlmC with PRC-barrel domain